MPTAPSPSDRLFAAFLLEEVMPEIDARLPAEAQDLAPEIIADLLERLWYAAGLARLAEKPEALRAIEQLQATLEAAPAAPRVLS